MVLQSSKLRDEFSQAPAKFYREASRPSCNEQIRTIRPVGLSRMDYNSVDERARRGVSVGVCRHSVGLRSATRPSLDKVAGMFTSLYMIR